MFKCMDWQRLSKEDIVKAIKENKLSFVEFELDENDEISIHTGIIGECDIAIEIDFKDAMMFFPG